MRRKFAKELYEIMEKDEDVILLVGDLGYGMLDRIRDAMPEQFYNVGAAEHTMMAVAVGLALSGKIPVVYTITPFFFRCFEVIRNYVNHEQIPVIMVGSGRGKDYKDAGFSHDASDHDIFRNFENIEFLAPDDFNLYDIIYSNKPTYLNLKR